MNEEAREAALASGISPLDYMLELLRDEENDRDTRFKAAQAAAPYVHGRLAAIEHSGPEGGPLQVQVIRFEDDQ